MDRPRSWHSQGIDLSAERPLRIGGARIDPVSREARWSAGSERLQPQNLKVLIALARRKGQVVTRTDLIDLCWDGRIVGEDVINHAILVLRGFASRAGGFAIETVPKAGYRLVEQSGGAAAAAPGRRRAGLAALSAVLLAIAGLVLLQERKPWEPPVPTVALVPFGAPAGDPLAAEVARQARVSLAHMLSESGFPARLASAPDRDADFLIAGDIRHASGRVEAAVRMELTRSRTVILSRRYEAAEKDAMGLADQIGASVATNLSWTAALMILDRRRPSDPQITSELLKQLTITVEGGDMVQAYEIARQAVQRAPDSATAQIALAFNSGFALSALPREQRAAALALGRQAAKRSRQLAPEFGDSYIPWWCTLHSPVRIAECEADLRRATRLDPEAPFTTAFLSTLMSDSGRNEEALELARLAIASDPYKPAKLFRVIRGYHVTGRRRQAEQVYEQAVRWWPDNDRVYWGRLMGLIEHGDFADIHRLARADPARLGPVDQLLTEFGAGRTGAVLRQCGETPPHAVRDMLCLLLLADLGHHDAAFAKADRMFPQLVGRTAEEEDRLWLDNPFTYPHSILSAPSAAALRRDPRFLDVAARLGLLAYWRTGRLPDFCRARPEPVCARIKAI